MGILFVRIYGTSGCFCAVIMKFYPNSFSKRAIASIVFS